MSSVVWFLPLAPALPPLVLVLVLVLVLAVLGPLRLLPPTTSLSTPAPLNPPSKA